MVKPGFWEDSLGTGFTFKMHLKQGETKSHVKREMQPFPSLMRERSAKKTAPWGAGGGGGPRPSAEGLQ